MDMSNMTREDIICMMDAEIDFAIDDHGWQGADGHWLTHEDLAKWTDEDYLILYFMLSFLIHPRSPLFPSGYVPFYSDKRAHTL